VSQSERALGNNEAGLLEGIAVAHAASGQIKFFKLLQLADRDCTNTHKKMKHAVSMMQPRYWV